MLTHMTTGEPVHMPHGMPRIYLMPLRELLADKYCYTCGIRGTETSVYAIYATLTGIIVVFECDLCGDRAVGTVSSDEI